MRLCDKNVHSLRLDNWILISSFLCRRYNFFSFISVLEICILWKNQPRAYFKGMLQSGVLDEQSIICRTETNDANNPDSSLQLSCFSCNFLPSSIKSSIFPIQFSATLILLKGNLCKLQLYLH